MKKIILSLVLLISLMFIASCELEEVYKVTFEANGGSKVAEVSVKSGEMLSIDQVSEKEDYLFDGWYLESSLKTKAEEQITVTKNITLYAKWVKNVFTVTFESNGGTKIDSVKVSLDGKVSAPANPEKENYDFDGWYADKTLKTAFDFEQAVTSDITLYAKWNGQTKTMVFSSNDNANIVAFEANRSEKTNKRTEFTDLTKALVVGDDNAVNLKPDTLFVEWDLVTDEVSESFYTDWTYVIKIYVKVEGEYELVEEHSEFIDSIDYEKVLIDFSDNAVGQSFKVEVYPEGLYGKQLDNMSDFTQTVTFDVVDGYNVYDELELMYLDNRPAGYDASADATISYKEEKGLSATYAPAGLIIQKNLNLEASDIAPVHFYGEVDLNKSDSDYARTLGSLRDEEGYYDIYYHVVSENEVFNVYGNYFALNFESLPVVTRESGEITAEGEVISHATLLKFVGAESGNIKVQDLNVIGNAPRVENNIKAGGVIFNKTQGPSIEFENMITACLFITYFPELTFKPYVVDKCKAYDSFNSFIYNWGSDKVEIKNSEMIGAGGPICIQDHVHIDDEDGGKIASTKFENCVLESFVSGTEGWFTVVHATPVVGPIFSLDALFNPFGKSFVKDNADHSLHFMNFILINKSGSAQAPSADSRVKGSCQIDDVVFDYGKSNPYVGAMMAAEALAAAPKFETSAGGYCFTDGATGIFDLTQTQIVNPTDPMYSGDYLCLYYNGMMIVVGYYAAGLTY